MARMSSNRMRSGRVGTNHRLNRTTADKPFPPSNELSTGPVAASGGRELARGMIR